MKILAEQIQSPDYKEIGCDIISFACPCKGTIDRTLRLLLLHGKDRNDSIIRGLVEI